MDDPAASDLSSSQPLPDDPTTPAVPTGDGLWEELTWRGLVAQSTDAQALREALAAGPLTFYVGFDPTAPSLHIGNLVQVLTARRLQQAGHRPLLLVGGATGLVGDPKMSGERVLNSPDVVAGWVSRIAGQVAPFVDLGGDDGPTDAVSAAGATVVNNLDWTAPMSAIELLRDVGQHFRLSRMLSKDAVAARLASSEGISYTEFSYQVMQALDYRELHRRYGCTLQFGGSDQWGNITAGVDLLHKADGVSVHALATPLVTRADGTKFGKTETGTVWLDAALTSPYAFYQFWLTVEDSMVGSYLRLFSFRGRSEIEALEAATRGRPAAREAARALARDVTSLVHGPGATAAVEAASAALFGRGGLDSLDAQTLAAAVAELPRAEVAAGEPLDVARLMAACGVVASVGAARRAIAEGGAYANNRRVDATWPQGGAVDAEDLLHGRWLVLRRGKRTLGVVEVVG